MQPMVGVIGVIGAIGAISVMTQFLHVSQSLRRVTSIVGFDGQT